MKVQVSQEELSSAVAQAQRAVSNRATLPVLSGVRIEANGRLTVSATDLETTIRASVDVTADEDGAVIAPAKFLAQTLKGLKGQTLRLVAADGELEIIGERGTYRMKSSALEDYPSLPMTGAPVAQIDAPALLAALSRVLPSASTDESRQVLTGVCFTFSDGTLELAATDSYRLSVDSVTYQGAADGRYVLPGRTLKELLRALKNVSGEVYVSIGGDDSAPTLTFSAGPVDIGARSTFGEFPNYKQLIPEGYGNAVTFDVADVQGMLSRVGLYAQNNLPVKLAFGDLLEMSAHTPDVGEASETVAVDFRGDPLVIAFNPAFLAAGLKACGSERVTIAASDGLKPATIRPAGCPHADGFLYLLMPVRLS